MPENKHSFIIKETRDIKEINAKVNIYLHPKTGARLIHIDTDDNNKVFSIAFRTPPTDDTGVAHIMEHSVLCGSNKFPSKEPFVELLKGSLNTFLNAFTASDYTMYPVASMNDKDFNNLVAVYLDAVFFPNVYKYEQILMQEGWHYELDNPEAELSISGVVYNEMKGAYSSPFRKLYKELSASIFPETPYRYESGGDPDAIPQLTQKMFLDFHKKHYHPSNSYIYLYGKLDINYYLELIEKEALCHFEAIETNTAIPYQTKINTPVVKTLDYPISSTETTTNKVWYGLQFLIDAQNNPEISFAFEVISHLLLDTPAAPLKQALLKSGICKDVMGSFDNSTIQPTFSVIIKDAVAEKAKEFETIVRNTLTELCSKGIDKSLVEASINIKEFNLREADFSGFPKGLYYIWNSACNWVHDLDPIEPLSFEERLENVKLALKSEYFESLIKYYILDNPHNCLVTMNPKKGLAEENNEIFRKKMSDIKKELSSPQIDGIISSLKVLKERQSTPDTPEALESIPLLSLSDINPKAEAYDYLVEHIGSVDYLHHPIFTNGIAYTHYYFDTSIVPQEDIKYLNILACALGSISTKKHHYSDLSNQINIHTGGINFNTSVFNSKDNIDDYSPKFVVDAKVLVSKLPELLNLIEEILNTSDFDDYSRLLEIINQEKSSMELSIINSGHYYAGKRHMAYYSQLGVYNEELDGIDHYVFIKELAKNFEDMKLSLAAKLFEISKLIFNANNLTLSFTSPVDDYLKYKELVNPLISSLNQKVYPKVNYKFELIKANEAFLTPGKVQFVCKGFNFQQLNHKYHGSMRVMTTVARLDYLWNTVRVLGGAYGAMLSLSYSGNFTTNSYRDPHLKETLKNYNGLAAFIKDLDLSDRELTKYIIGTISTYDTPETPSTKSTSGDRNYFSHIDNNFLQENRNQMLSTKLSDLRKMSSMIEDVMKQNRYCVFGNEAKIKENLDLFQTVIALFE